jgi:hypothetical protein
MTANDNEAPVKDDWDASKHTSLENTMAAMIKFLLSRVVGPRERDEIARTFPELWGHERRG